MNQKDDPRPGANREPGAMEKFQQHSSSTADRNYQSRRAHAMSATSANRWASAGAMLDITPMSQIDPRSVSWLWPDRIPLGKLTLLMGDPGTGKSVLTIDLAAHVSTGAEWPDGTSCPPGDVLILSAEDDPDDTIRPRLDAAGANVSRVHWIRDVTPGLQLDPNGLDQLNQAFTTLPQVRLIIIDPISAFVGNIDSHKNTEVRNLLAPLARLAGEHEIAILAVTHMNKTGGGKAGGGSAIYRGMGSLAFIAAPRAAHVVTKDKDDPERRLFLPVKNNLAPDRGGLSFRIEQAENRAPRITWDARRVDISADDAVQPPDLPPRPTAQAEAQNWLSRQISAGSVPSEEIEELAEKAGISKTTLQRAKEALGIRSQKIGKDWYYVPPAGQDTSGVWH